VRVNAQRFEAPPATGAWDGPDFAAWEAAPFSLIFFYPNRVIVETAVPSSEPVDREARVGSCGLRLRYYRRVLGTSGSMSLVDSIADAHTVVQTVWGLESLIARIAGYLNVEIYARGAFDLVGVARSVIEYHKKYGGRTEMRRRAVAGTEVIWGLDLSVPARVKRDRQDPPSVVEWLQLMRRFGAARAAAHPGKYVPISLAPIERVTLVDLFSDARLGQALLDQAETSA
jgi:hypothetical protein